MNAFVAGVVAGYGIAVSVGAIGVLVMGLAAGVSFRVGAAAALAVATADACFAAVAALGGTALADRVAPVAGPLRVTAAVVLLAVAGHTAWRALRHRDLSGTTPRTGLTTPVRAFTGVFTLTLLNPTTVVYFAALVLGRPETAGGGPVGVALFTSGAFVASASWQFLLAGGGMLAGRVLTGPRGRLLTALAASVLIAALAVGTLLPGAPAAATSRGCRTVGP